jgi:putative glutamine amidotransferase
MSRPRIGVTGVTREWEGQTRTGVNAAYVRAVLAVGGVPILLVPELSPEETIDLFGECDALLLTGGEDVDPACYGAECHPKLGTVDRRRDANELALVADARARDLPILGICRGIQLLNVAFGGSLIQDIPSQRPSAINHDPATPRDAAAHGIEITDGSRLGQLLETTALEANSFHHQAVDRVGTGLVVTATAPDGMIEGLESSDPLEWIVAVQWHPEELAITTDAIDRRLFAAMVAAARR